MHAIISMQLLFGNSTIKDYYYVIHDIVLYIMFKKMTESIEFCHLICYN